MFIQDETGKISMFTHFEYLTGKISQAGFHSRLSNHPQPPSLGGEKHECKRYNKEVILCGENGKQGGLFSGVSIGVTMLVMFGTYGLAFW